MICTKSIIEKTLTKLYRIKSTVDFDLYEIIFIHNFLFVMFVFLIVVFLFFLNFVKITTFFKIDDNQYVTKMIKHIVIAFKN